MYKIGIPFLRSELVLHEYDWATAEDRDELELQLAHAIKTQDYELAADIRDTLMEIDLKFDEDK